MFNPIIRAERAFQGRTLRRPGWLSSPLVFGLLIGGSSAAGLMLPYAGTWAARTGATLFDTSSTLSRIQSVLTLLVILNLFADYWRVVGGAVRGASVALTREYQARTWESLILTGVSARRLVIGKWWGVLRAVWQGERRMLMIRAVAFLWLLSPLANADIDEFRIISAQVIGMALLVALLTPPLMSGFAAALGIMVSAVVRREAISVRAGMGGLLLVTLVVQMTTVIVGAAAGQSMLKLFSALVPLEGGILTVMSLGFDMGGIYGEPVTVSIEGLLMTTAVLIALSAAALYAAVLMARRQGALAHD
jgi:hypothetical protein